MTEGDEELIANYLFEWDELWKEGRDIPPAELCQNHPHLADELARELARLGLFRNRHRVLEIEYDRVGAAFERLAHDLVLDAGREQRRNHQYVVVFLPVE